MFSTYLLVHQRQPFPDYAVWVSSSPDRSPELNCDA